jgi:short-subunit dehydrogenase
MVGRYALITGGSSGIGAAIADQLAGQGANLVLVARDADQLEKVVAGLRERHGATVLSVPLSLDQRGAPTQLMETVREAGIEVEMLINNACVKERT